MTKPAIQILMIEDSQTDVLLLEEALSRDAFNSFELTIVERLGNGLETLHKSKFDLVLLDLGLPDSQGLETFEKLHKEFPELPVVVLSGLMDERVALEAVQAGAQDYLVKGPTSWEIASRAIRYAIERQQSQAAMRETNEALQALIQASPAGIIVLDPDGDVRLWSPANEHIFGWSETEALGKFLPYIAEDKREEHEALRRRVLQGEAFTGVEARRQRKDRSFVDISISTAPLRDNQGNITGILGLNIDITKRKKAEEALRASEERFSTVFRAIPMSIAVTRLKDNQFLDVNEAWQDLTGFTREEAIGHTAAELNVWADPTQRERLIGLLPEEGAMQGLEIQLRRKSGEVSDLLFSAVAIEMAGEACILSMALDITERKRAERLLTALNRSAEAMAGALTPDEVFRAASGQLKAAGLDCIVLPLDKNSDNYIARYLSIAPELLQRLENLTGINHEDFSIPIEALDVFERVRLENHAVLVENAEPLVRQLLPRPLKGLASQIVKALHNPRYISAPMTVDDIFVGIFAAQSNDLSAKDLPAITAFADQMALSLRKAELFQQAQNEINERKQAEAALQESEERFRSLYNNATIGMYRTTPDGRILMCNPAAIRLLGFESFDELAKRNLEEDGFEPDYSRREFHERMERDGMVIGLECEWTRKDGTPIFVRESATAVRDSQGMALYYDGTFEDITSRKQAEEAIRLSEKKFKTLFEIAPVGISVLDRGHNIVDANYTLQMITGLRKNELMNGVYRKRTYLRPDGTVMTPDEFANARALKENMPIFDVETGIVTEDRGVVWTQVSAAPLDMPGAGLVVITQDISERKLSEQALRQRLAELETLYESGLILSQITNPEEIAQKLIALMTEKLEWHHVTIRRYHAKDGSLELLAFSHPDMLSDKKLRTIKKRFQSMISKTGEGLSGWVAQHGETVRCNDVMHDPRYLEVEPGLQSGLYVPMKIGDEILGVISIESELPDAFTDADERLITTLAAQAAIALDNNLLIEDLQKSKDRIIQAYDDTIEGWSHALDLRDRETEGHTQRVTTLTEDLAREMGVTDSNMVHIRRGALLHDIGKMGVPDRILLKPDKLTAEEWIIMRQHSAYAYNLLSRIEFLRPALNIPHYHHERWDGSGYPDGLRWEQIPLEARIFAVIDVFDALTSDRPYRPAWPKDKAISYIREQAGTHFDPKVVEVFMILVHRK